MGVFSAKLPAAPAARPPDGIRAKRTCRTRQKPMQEVLERRHHQLHLLISVHVLHVLHESVLVRLQYRDI